MALWDRISAMFTQTRTTTQQKAPVISYETPIGTVGGAVAAEYQKLRADQERLAIIRTCRVMYKTDPRIKRALTNYARDLVRSGFFVKTDNVQAAQIASDLQKRLNLNQKMEDAVRLSGRDGDSFFELNINDGFDITKMTRKPTMQMCRNSNEFDEFDNPVQAFYMTQNTFVGLNPPVDAIYLADWQVIHARWDHDEENRYGTPMMASATGAFKRVSEGEMDVAVRRKVRAGMRMHHVVEGTSSDIEAYKEINKAALSNPFAAQLDYFTNKAGSINVLQGDAHLNEIGDILHQIKTMFAASDVPLELVAYGDDLNRDVLGEKKEEYDENLRQGREWVSSEILKPLFERQWLLKGIYPESVNYQIVWRTAKGLTPTDLRDLGDGMMRLRVLGVKEEVIQSILAQYLPNVDMDILTGDGIDSQRFADMLKGLSI